METKMREMNIKPKFVSLIMELLRNRETFVRYNGRLYGPRLANIELPQGSGLSPIFFNLYTYDLKEVVKEPVCALQYADDIALYVIDKDWEKCKEYMSNSVLQLEEWLKYNGLELAHEKWVVMQFSRHRKYDHIGDIQLGKHKFPVMDEHKILGITYDKKIKFKSQILNICRKCEKGINILKTICNMKWGAHPAICLNIYKALIRCHLDTISFMSKNLTKRDIDKLNKIQYSAIRISLGALKSSPINTLLAESGELPLESRWEIISKRYLISKVSRNDEIVLQTLNNVKDLCEGTTYWSRKENPILVSSYLWINKYKQLIAQDLDCQFRYPLEYKWVNQNNIIIDKTTDNPLIQRENMNFIFKQEINKTHPNYTLIFTDGSKKECAGCAVYVPRLNIEQKYKLPKSASSFTAEMTAIKIAINIIEEEKITKSVILSDCKSALEAIKRTLEKANKIVYEIIDKTMSLRRKGFDLKFMWIKGHAGITENEKADELAKEGCYLGTEISSLLSADINKIVMKEQREKWQSIFDNISQRKGKIYREINSDMHSKPWFQKITENCMHITTVIRMRIGHTKNRSFRLRDGISRFEECDCEEGGPENTDHIVFRCKKYTTQRKAFYQRLEQKNIVFTTNTTIILAMKNMSIYKDVTKYLFECQKYL
ncbi:uncharacterized protein LOC113374239 [Ctenocephalides felis]|uniref:uncharacterized protein LOC113374239 n=1 Tax=Ctenocephalides felis TaxID=7515 RepID=UPI000E6E201F|nr:uncharacterized protein LOC113374239 [Ctenocephalides felis]